MMNRSISTNTKPDNNGPKLLASRVMPDSAMAIAVEYMGDIIVTRMYLTQLVGFIHQHHLKEQSGPPYINGPSRTNFKFDIASADYHVMTVEQYNESTFHQAIPEYRSVPALEYKHD